MARPEHTRSPINVDAGYQAGGPVATMHQAIETHMITGNWSLPNWTLYADTRSPMEEAMHHLSRAIGVAALVTGLLSIIAGLYHLF